MAGRPKKNSMFDDIKEIETTEEKPVKKVKVEKVEKAPEPSLKTGVVKTDSWLNVRNGPAISCEAIGKLKNGEPVAVYEEKDGWGKISDISEMWVNLDFVTF